MNIILLIVALVIGIGVAISESFDPTTFETTVLKDERVWIIEFYSSMCGSCTEFAPIWNKLESILTTVVTSKVSIDEKSGMELAQKLGVLEEGIPNIRLFTSNSKVGITILSGEEKSYKELSKLIKHHITETLHGINDIIRIINYPFVWRGEMMDFI